jgi:outer membrane biosynthesis protein TonB
MRAVNLCSSVTLLLVFCTACSHKSSSTPQQAQAPPLQTSGGTLPPLSSTQQQEKSTSPLASPLPPPSEQSVPLPPPPPPKKVRRRTKPAPSKPVDSAQAPEPAPQTTQVSVQQPPGAGAGSPIGQLTTGDSALGEKTKRETLDLIGGTQQGLMGIKRSLSTEEKTTVAQIRNYLKQAQQALDTGDTDGAHLLATKAKALLDELTKP